VYDRVVKVVSNRHYQQILYGALPRAKSSHMADMGFGLRDNTRGKYGF